MRGLLKKFDLMDSQSSNIDVTSTGHDNKAFDVELKSVKVLKQ